MCLLASVERELEEEVVGGVNARRPRRRNERSRSDSVNSSCVSGAGRRKWRRRTCVDRLARRREEEEEGCGVGLLRSGVGGSRKGVGGVHAWRIVEREEEEGEEGGWVGEGLAGAEEEERRREGMSDVGRRPCGVDEEEEEEKGESGDLRPRLGMSKA